MNIYRYTTGGGKDLIKDYLDKLPIKERVQGYEIMEALEEEGLAVLDGLNTRQLKKKLWEIKFSYKERMMYVVGDCDNFYILHVCKKQKGKAELFELNKAIKRAKELGEELNKKFV